MNPASVIAAEINASSKQVAAAIALIDEGATVPFIARYRKEKTGGLDDTRLRHLEQRLVYLRELQQRREKIIESISAQGKLSDALQKQLQEAESKTDLEDLYLPFKPRRRTRAQIAREAGLQGLADLLFDHPQRDAGSGASSLTRSNASPEVLASEYLKHANGVDSVSDALQGARDIVIEEIMELVQVTRSLRDFMRVNSWLSSTVIKNKKSLAEKYADYFDYSEALKTVPSHRALALFRGHREGFLRLAIDLPEVNQGSLHPCIQRMASCLNVRAHNSWMMETLGVCWKSKLHPKLEAEFKAELRERADVSAIDVFARNLRSLLLAAPAGARATMGLDPGFRNGVKVAVTDATGKLVETATIYPHEPHNRRDAAIDVLASLIKRHEVSLIAVGNGTASRETDRLVDDLLSRHPQPGLQKLMVSEAGASVYSASEVASRELPDVDVSLRGAASIARRLQDPLAELVKVEPRAIGVGQYQHDVDQSQLARSLDNVVEDCVNAVGVDLNSASAELLMHVSGLSPTLARNIVAYRDTAGRFRSRNELRKVTRLGPKAFEQCAGFLRIMDGDHALDASSVHPEAYPLAKQIAKATGKTLKQLIGDTATLSNLDPALFVTDQYGLPTVVDVISELEKPGRDPRPDFKTVSFREGVEKITDLEVGMVLEGVISNVTHFGAFVDIGVHQDGLVHISALADRFVRDPHEVVAAGDIVRVKVMDIDIKRKRIALSMKTQDAPAHESGHASSTTQGKASSDHHAAGRQNQVQQSSLAGALGEAMAEASLRKPDTKSRKANGRRH